MIDINYLLRILVYAQSFVWIYLLDKDIKFNSIFIESLFVPSLAVIYFLLDMTRFSFNQYPYYLLCFYVVLVFYSYIILRFKYSFYDTICITFIIVFINSYYWEFMFHLNAIIFYGLSFNQFIQVFHLIPAYLLYKQFEIVNKVKFYKLIIIGLIISNLNLLAHNYIKRFWFYGIPFNQQLYNNVTRFICLNILLFATMRYTILIKKRKGILSYLF